MPERAELSDEARTFIEAHRIGRLATATVNGAPHVVPICYALTGGRLYFVADEKPKRRGPHSLKRLANIAQNPRAALLIDDYSEDWERLAFLLLHLDAAQVEHPAEYATALTALRARYAAYRDMPLAIGTHPMVGMTVRRWHLWRAA